MGQKRAVLGGMVGMLALAGAAIAAGPSPVVAQQGPPPLPANATPVAQGLNSPRGFAWGPDGNLYVAEAGAPPPGFMPSEEGHSEEGPAAVGMTGRISRIARDGTRTTVV